MKTFICEKIDVIKASNSISPCQFTWRGKIFKIAQIIDQRVDTRFDSNPYRNKNWRSRHHRINFKVRTAEGDIFELYLDYSKKHSPEWILLAQEGPDSN